MASKHMMFAVLYCYSPGKCKSKEHGDSISWVSRWSCSMETLTTNITFLSPRDSFWNSHWMHTDGGQRWGVLTGPSHALQLLPAALGFRWNQVCHECLHWSWSCGIKPFMAERATWILLGTNSSVKMVNHKQLHTSGALPRSVPPSCFERSRMVISIISS